MDQDREKFGGGWMVHFADKLPFREAWKDLRVLFFFLSCGRESFEFDGVQVP